MTFKSYCYEKWLQYMEEMLAWNDHGTLPYSIWAKEGRWRLRRMYRNEYGKLQKPWKPCNVRNLANNVCSVGGS